MERPWTVLLVVGCVLIAGCSLPGSGGIGEGAAGGGGSDGEGGSDGFSYPQGWDASGLANASLAVEGADSAISGQDFVERRVAVQPTNVDGERNVLVDELVVRVDRENRRLLTVRRFYLVSNETAKNVAERGPSALGNRSPGEVQQHYFNASGNVEYRSIGERAGISNWSSSATFEGATDQPLPAVFASAMAILESGSYANATTAESSVTYSIEGASSSFIESGSGEVTVRSSGLVSGFEIVQLGPGRPAGYRYSLEAHNVTVVTPSWIDEAS